MPAKTTGSKKKTTSAASRGRSTAKKTTSGTRTKKSSAAPKQKPQRRELWVLGAFFVFLITMLAALHVEGFLLEWILRTGRGLLGVGVYVFPFVSLAACLTILFAAGKPVAARLWSLGLLPLLIGMLEHTIFAKDAFSIMAPDKLYEAGLVLKSGGVIAGGLAALLSSALSSVGAMLICILLILADLLVVLRLPLTSVFTFLVGLKEQYDERREARLLMMEEEYEDTYDEPDAPEPVPSKPARRKAPDLPLEPVTPVEPPSAPPDPFRPARRMNGLRAPGVKTPLDVVRPASPQPEPSPVPSDEEAPFAHDAPVPAEAPAFNPAAAEVEADDFSDADEAYLDDAPPADLSPALDLPRARVSLDASQAADAPPFETGPRPPSADIPEPVVVDTHIIEKDDTEIDPAADLTAGVPYEFPPITLLKKDTAGPGDDATEELRTRSQKLTDTLSSFGVEAQIINVTRGPSVTRYEMQLDRGVKFSRLTALQDDIALALGATGVRIAPIPDKFAVGIEVPNKVVQIVRMRDVLTSREMSSVQSKVAFTLGRDITGASCIADLARMPHLLIAGTTGSGKSVCINSVIISFLYRASPEEVRLIMIDPKMVELGNYNGIPHLLIPVVTDYKKAAGALNWAVMEMERRYKLMFEQNVRDFSSYNAQMRENGGETIPQIVIIIDELADLMMVAAKEVEEAICRIAQKARAAGMHLIIATQRPSADVLTGLMKSNIPSRIAFSVASQIESRIILDTGGAEKLIGRGDMLFAPIGQGKPTRIQGCFLSGEEVEAVVDFIKRDGNAEYSSDIIEQIERQTSSDGGIDGSDDDDADVLLPDAIDVVMDTGQASASMLQRRLKLGYARAARMIDQMEARGIIGSFEGSKPRQILISKSDWQEMKLRRAQ